MSLETPDFGEGYQNTGMRAPLLVFSVGTQQAPTM